MVKRRGNSIRFSDLCPLVTPNEDRRATPGPSLSALKDVSPQTVEFGTEKSLVAKSSKLGLWSLPIEANTKQAEWVLDTGMTLSLIHISEPTRQAEISYAVFCLKKKKN